MGRKKSRLRPSRWEAWGLTLACGSAAFALQFAWTLGPLQGMSRWLVVPTVIGLIEAALLPWALRKWALRRGRPPEARYWVTGFLLSWMLATLYVFLRWAVE